MGGIVVQWHMIRRPHPSDKLAMAIAIVTFCCMASKSAVRSSSSSSPLIASAFTSGSPSALSRLAGRHHRLRLLRS